MKKFVMLDAHTLPEADYHQEREILAEAGYECVIAQCKTMDEVVDFCSDADVIGDVYFKIDDVRQLEEGEWQSATCRPTVWRMWLRTLWA